MAMLGILGGGQLGRMLALAAGKLGLSVHIYAPEPDSPAAAVAAAFTCAAYDDTDALLAFAQSVAAITYEFENVPAATAELLNAHAPVRPNPRALAVTQDRWHEKSFIRAQDIATAPFYNIESEADLGPALAKIGPPAVLKTRRLGYDGKGQRLIRQGTDLAAAFDTFNRVPSILEGFVAFKRELSVIAARGLDGQFAAYDPVENQHQDHVLHRSLAPAKLTPEQRDKALAIAAAILSALDYVGVMGIELFEAADGSLMVNELAPRVHNSGHWTQDACTVSQFEQHVRAVMGWPLGSPERHSDAIMTNLLGEAAQGWDTRALGPHTSLHLYGKDAPRPGRKMGHLTELKPKTSGHE
ncbi:MAG TPA: 5-(carboxyamino)imidazole ribonucleotide synthase [Alphaproteobacteria bacterium]|nr:5-(carboxyamino)imidazole ribonucleotide synthase [Alphaproteobacteria bacterium]HAJ47354.1 5-(carboxyamino)imidazole ribonucleotide synthase [Alphaproteobacteria bacterium]